MNQLNTATKLIYGLGFSARGIKDGLFQLFLFFYFNQVLGLDPALAGIATVIALLFDAVSDPLIGVWSDNFKSEKWGRRHPFMLLSAIPFGIFLYLLFIPPSDMGQQGLFLWLTIFSILVRLSLTFFLIPAMSLGAELTTDYDERTSVTSYRVMFAALVAPIIIIFGLLTYFKPTEEMSNGLFNAAAYPKYAMLCSIVAVLMIIVSTIGTRHTIPFLPKSELTEQPTFFSLFSKFGTMIRMKSFRSLVGYLMIINIGIGVGTTLIPYFTTYFFGLSEKALALMAAAPAMGGILALLLAPRMGKRWDKKKACFISSIISSLFFSTPFSLRLLDMFPENGSTYLLPAYLLLVIVGYTFLFVVLSLVSSMMADVIDEYDLQTGKREEGLFFSSMSFAYKCTVGLGSFVAGILLKVIQFPSQTDLADVPQTAIDGLGYIGGPFLLLLYLSAILCLLIYPITKEKYEEIRLALEQR